MSKVFFDSLIQQLQLPYDPNLSDKSSQLSNQIGWHFNDFPNIGNLKYALGIQLACESLSINFNIKAFYSLSSCNKKVYDSCLIEVRKKFNLYPKIDLRTIGIRYGCELVVDKVFDLLEKYKAKCTQVVPDAKDDFFTHPSIPIACFIICCEVNKIKINQVWLHSISLMNTKELKQVIKNIKLMMNDELIECKLDKISNSYQLRKNHQQSITTTITSQFKPTIDITKTTNGALTSSQVEPSPNEIISSVSAATDSIPTPSKPNPNKNLINMIHPKKRKSMIDDENILESENFKRYLIWKKDILMRLKSN